MIEKEDSLRNGSHLELDPDIGIYCHQKACHLPDCVSEYLIPIYYPVKEHGTNEIHFKEKASGFTVDYSKKMRPFDLLIYLGGLFGLVLGLSFVSLYNPNLIQIISAIRGLFIL